MIISRNAAGNYHLIPNEIWNVIFNGDDPIKSYNFIEEELEKLEQSKDTVFNKVWSIAAAARLVILELRGRGWAVCTDGMEFGAEDKEISYYDLYTHVSEMRLCPIRDVVDALEMRFA
jgi:hypothetical protein